MAAATPACGALALWVNIHEAREHAPTRRHDLRHFALCGVETCVINVIAATCRSGRPSGLLSISSSSWRLPAATIVCKMLTPRNPLELLERQANGKLDPSG